MAEATTTTAPADRRPLTRQHVLEEALRLVDEQGLQALTMRALGKRLGVEGMTVHYHVGGKAALHAGIGELLWAELARSAAPAGDWLRSMRSVAAPVRRLAREHPNAYPLMLAGRVSPAPGLRMFQSQLAALRAAGYDETRAAEILRAVFGYAFGYAMMELSMCVDCGPSAAAADFDTVLELSRMLPADLPPDLVHVARVVCLADLDRQFDLGLDALLAGLGS